MAQPQASAKAQVRQNATVNLWTAPAKPVQYGRETFRFRVDRSARKLPTLNLDAWVESANWERANGQLTGTLAFRRSLDPYAASMVANGDMLICEWAQWGTSGPWLRLWQMNVADPSHQVFDGILTPALTAVADPLTKSKVAWKFRADQQHPHGWTADQMTVSACRRFHMPIGRIPKGQHHVAKYAPKSASPTDVIAWAWTQERQHTGRKFDIDFSAGVVNVTELQQPRFVLVLGASMNDATVTQSLTGIASAVIATATRKGTGKSTSKLRARVVDQARADRYGYIAKTLSAPAGISSTAELRKWATQQLADLFATQKQITFTHPGIPLVDVGTPLQIYLPEADVSQTVFVTDARHDLSASAYQMSVTVSFDDPFSANIQSSGPGSSVPSPPLSPTRSNV